MIGILHPEEKEWECPTDERSPARTKACVRQLESADLRNLLRTIEDLQICGPCLFSAEAQLNSVAAGP